MMQKIRGSYPLEVEEIVFTDGSRLEKKTVMILDPFLLVEGPPGEPPDMHAIHTVDMLRGVRELRPEMKIGAW